MQHDRRSGEPLTVCRDCGDLFNTRSARLGSSRCPRCDRRNDRRRGRC